MKAAVRRLDDRADRQAFDSGVPELDWWLQQQAGQAQRKRLASVWIAATPDRPKRIVGYYSLAPWQVAFADCPDTLTRRLPRYPIAVTLIGRLAVDRTFQGQGLGGALLADALARAHAASEAVPVQAVVVHAKNERAAGFYKANDFIPFPERPQQLYLPMKTIAALFPEK